MIEIGTLVAIASAITFIMTRVYRYKEERMIEDMLKKFTFETWLDYEHEQARKAQEEE